MPTYNGSAGNNYYDYAGTGNLSAYGNAGNDSIYGNYGDDALFGGSGDDNLGGYYGNDVLFGDSGNDYLFGDYGNDRIFGGWDDDILNGYDGNDIIHGETGNDYLVGGNGNDILQGTNSNLYDSYEYDTLIGDNTSFIGPNGNDTFVIGTAISGNFYRGSGYATIRDYNSLYDYIQIKNTGSLSLAKNANYGGMAGLDTAIYDNGDLLAIVHDNTTLQLTSYYFKFV